MINGGDSWRESSMDTEYAALNYGCNGEIVEDFVEIVPHIIIAVLLSYFIIKPIHEGNISGLMISSQQDHFIWILEFQQQ